MTVAAATAASVGVTGTENHEPLAGSGSQTHAACLNKTGCSTISQRPSDIPTPAMSRAFFREQESLLAQQASAPCVSTSPPATTHYIFTVNDLETVCNYLGSVESVASIDGNRFPVLVDRVIADLKGASGSVFTVVASKLRECQEVLSKYTAGDSRLTRRVAAHDDAALFLVDRLLDVFGIIKCTTGVWDIKEEQRQALTILADEFSVSVTEFQRRATFHLKARAKRSGMEKLGSENVPPGCAGRIPSELVVEAMGRLALSVTTALRENLVNASSLLRLDAATAVERRHPIVNALVSGTAATGTQHAEGSLPKPAVTSLIAYIQTVSTLQAMPLVQQLFRLPELDLALAALKGVRAGLQEVSLRQRFNWQSSSEQQCFSRHQPFFLPQPDRQLSFPKCAERTATGVATERSLSLKPNTGMTPADGRYSDELQAFISVKLEELSRSLLAFYRLLGTVLGGGYEDLRIQQELTAITVLGSYISLVGFLFYDDLDTLARWAAPYLSNVRKALRKHNETGIPKQHSSYNPPDTATNESSLFLSINSKPTSTVITAFVDILSRPTDISLSRHVESEALVQLFLPHCGTRLPSQSGRNFNAAPATRINRLLVWLAWEGDLLQLYSDITATPSGAPPETSNHAERSETPAAVDRGSEHIENALLDAIMNGFVSVTRKFAKALPLLFESFAFENVVNPITHGENVLELCNRMLESLSLCYLGEVDLKATRDLFFASMSTERLQQTPRLHQCLALYLGQRALLQKPTQVSSRITEGIPKLIYEYLHQSLFYAVPLNYLKTTNDHSASASLSYSAASTARISGLLAQMDRRVTRCQQTGQLAFHGSDQNRETLALFNARLTALEAKFSDKDVATHQVIPVASSSVNPSAAHATKKCGSEPGLGNALATGAASVINDPASPIADPSFADKSEDCCALQQQWDVLRSTVTEALDAFKKRIEKIEVDMGLEAQKAQLPDSVNHYADLSTKLDTLSATMAQNAKRIADVKTDMNQLQTTVKNMQTSLVNCVIERTKNELSVYLTQTLSQCIQNHVTYALEKQQQQSSTTHRRRSRLLPWTPPRKSWEPDSTSSAPSSTTLESCLNTKIPAPNGQHGTKVGRVSKGPFSNGMPNVASRPPPTTQVEKDQNVESHIPHAQKRRIWRGFDIDVDTLSIMQEYPTTTTSSNATEQQSWFDGTTQLLDMPDPAVYDDDDNNNAEVQHEQQNNTVTAPKATSSCLPVPCSVTSPPS